jgi:hypothetical protein
MFQRYQNGEVRSFLVDLRAWTSSELSGVSTEGGLDVTLVIHCMDFRRLKAYWCYV